MNLEIIKEGAGIFYRSQRAKLFGVKKFKGSAEEICEQIVAACWNGTYFQTSLRNYPVFYTRDFSFCTEALLKLGYDKEVEKTLSYALAAFKKRNVSVAINQRGAAFDFPVYAVDSLPLLLRSLRVSKNKQLIREYYELLNDEAELFFTKAIDPASGLVKKKHFSSIRDYSVRKSSAYDNIMAGLLQSELSASRLINPLQGYNYKRLLLDHFWTGDYFRNDLESEHLCVDGTIFPFWAGVITDKKIMKRAFAAIQREKLDQPFPARYVKDGIKENMIAEELFAPNWERNTVWGHLGMIYIEELQKIDRKKAAQHISEYKEKIEQHGSFLELYSQNGKPYSSIFYYSDEGMLWSSLFLNLVRKVL